MQSEQCWEKKTKKTKPWTCLSASALTMVQWAQHSLSHPAVKHPNENKQEDGGRQVAKVEKHELRNMNFYDSIKHNFFESSSHKQRKIMFCYLQSWLPCYSAPFWDFRRRKKQTRGGFPHWCNAPSIVTRLQSKQRNKGFLKIVRLKENRPECSSSLSISPLLFLSVLFLLHSGGLQGEVMLSDANCYKMSG